MRVATIRRIAVVGVAATVTMDVGWTAWRLLGGRRVSDKVGPELLGRWTGHLRQGRFRHRDIRETPSLAKETAVGMAAHYATGVALTGAYFAMLHVLKIKPSTPVALAYGTATGGLPWLVLYPAYGYGWFGLREEPNGALIATSAIGHIVFGFGIGVWTKVFDRCERSRRIHTWASG